MGIFTARGTSLGFAATGAAAGTMTAFGAGVVATAAVGGIVGSQVYSAQQQKKAMKQSMKSMPQPVTAKGAPATAENIIKEAQTTAQETTLVKRKAMARSKSIYTSPLGYEEEATLAKKTLLGR